MLNDLPDPDEEKALALLYRKLANELQPVGELEILWCKQIAIAYLRNDVAAMRIATLTLKKCQWLRHCTDAAATLKALEGY